MNPADSLTIYRFPVTELERFGFQLGQVPYLKQPFNPEDEEEMEKFRAREREWPEEVVFSFGDLVELYRDHAEHDPRIKSFVETVKEYVE